MLTFAVSVCIYFCLINSLALELPHALPRQPVTTTLFYRSFIKYVLMFCFIFSPNLLSTCWLCEGRTPLKQEETFCRTMLARTAANGWGVRGQRRKTAYRQIVWEKAALKACGEVLSASGEVLLQSEPLAGSPDPALCCRKMINWSNWYVLVMNKFVMFKSTCRWSLYLSLMLSMQTAVGNLTQLTLI